VPSRPTLTPAAGARGCGGQDGHAFVTDGGHWILDAALERISDPKSLADRLDAITGVVEHGLFIGLAPRHSRRIGRW
jgi:ribose 5-phosphate isomerase